MSKKIVANSGSEKRIYIKNQEGRSDIRIKNLFWISFTIIIALAISLFGSL
jgi:hypothetical protein